MGDFTIRTTSFWYRHISFLVSGICVVGESNIREFMGMGLEDVAADIFVVCLDHDHRK